MTLAPQTVPSTSNAVDFPTPSFTSKRTQSPVYEPHSDQSVTALQLSWRVGGGFIRSNRNIKSAGTQPRLMNVIWWKDQRETYALILNFVPQTFSFIKKKKKKKCLCSKFGALAPATYLLLSHQKKKKAQKKNRGAQLMMWSCWSCQMWCNPKTSAMIKDSACCTTDNVLRWESPLLLEFWNEPLGRDCFFWFFYTVSHVKPWWNQGLT